MRVAGSAAVAVVLMGLERTLSRGHRFAIPNTELVRARRATRYDPSELCFSVPRRSIPPVLKLSIPQELLELGRVSRQPIHVVRFPEKYLL